MGEATLSDDLSLADRAQLFAASVHHSQKYGEADYTLHLENVVDTLLRFGYGDDENLLAAAWLHDTLEDTFVTFGQLESLFNADVAMLTWRVSGMRGKNRESRQNYPRVRETSRSVCLKLADRIANARHSVMSNNERYLALYRHEYMAFRSALFAPGEFEPMWTELDGLLGNR